MNEWQRLFKATQGARPSALVVVSELWYAIDKGYVSIGEVWAILADGEQALMDLIEELNAYIAADGINFDMTVSTFVSMEGE